MLVQGYGRVRVGATHSNAGWGYREGVPDRNVSDIECVSEASHSVLNLGVRQHMVKLVFCWEFHGRGRTKDGKFMFTMPKCILYHMMRSWVLRHCRSVGQLRSCLRAVTLVFQSYLRCTNSAVLFWMPSRSLVFLAVWAFHGVDAYSKHSRTRVLQVIALHFGVAACRVGWISPSA